MPAPARWDSSSVGSKVREEEEEGKRIRPTWSITRASGTALEAERDRLERNERSAS